MINLPKVSGRPHKNSRSIELPSDNNALIDAQRRLLIEIWPKVRHRLGLDAPRSLPGSVAELDELIAQTQVRDSAQGNSVVSGPPIFQARSILRAIESLQATRGEPTSVSRSTPDSFHHKWTNLIQEQIGLAETRLAVEEPVPPGSVVGLYVTHSLPLLSQSRWQSSGQFQCADSRYLDFVISGIDTPTQNLILNFSLSIFDAREAGQNHARFLADSRNSYLTWEYTSPEFIGVERLGLHVHRQGTPEWRYYPEPPPEPITIEACADILNGALNAIHDPEAFWSNLLIDQV